MLAKVTTLLKDGSSFDLGQARHKNPKRLTTSVHLNRGDPAPIIRRLPLPILKELSHFSAKSVDEGF